MGQMSLKERTHWAIDYVIKRYRPSNVKLADELGFNRNTISCYRAERVLPSARFISKFCDRFGFNEKWFLQCREAPFDEAATEFPAVCGDPDKIKKHEEAPEIPGSWPSCDTSKDRLSRADLLAMTARVLESG